MKYNCQDESDKPYQTIFIMPYFVGYLCKKYGIH